MNFIKNCICVSGNTVFEISRSEFSVRTTTNFKIFVRNLIFFGPGLSVLVSVYSGVMIICSAPKVILNYLDMRSHIPPPWSAVIVQYTIDPNEFCFTWFFPSAENRFSIVNETDRIVNEIYSMYWN